MSTVLLSRVSGVSPGRGLALASLFVLGLVTVRSANGSSDYNIDFGLGTVPSASYVAVLPPGAWNSVGLLGSGVRQALVNLDGIADGPRIYMVGAAEVLESDDAATLGDDAALLDDMLIGFNAPLDVCIWIERLDPGDYEVVTYALTPNDPELLSRVRVDDGDPGPVHVGGAWPGFHAETVSYIRHVVPVGGNGILGLHSGEISAEIQSGINGLQVRRLTPSGAPEPDGSSLPLRHAAAFPNPSAGPQTVRLSGIPSGAAVPLEVVDLSGRIVWSRTVAADRTTTVEATWEGIDLTGRRLPAGIYFARTPGLGPVRLIRLW